MKRVKWKGPYVEFKLLKKITKSKLPSNKSFTLLKHIPKNSTILPAFIGLILKIYNGKTFISLKILEEMVGHKLGEFISTRKQFFYKKNK